MTEAEKKRLIKLLKDELFDVTSFRTMPYAKTGGDKTGVMGEAWLELRDGFKDHLDPHAGRPQRALIVHFHFGGTWQQPDFRWAAAAATACVIWVPAT